MGFGRNSSRIANRRLANMDQGFDLPKKRDREEFIWEEEEGDDYDEDPFY